VNDHTIARLKHLREAAESACKLANEHRAELPNSRVNWGDLHCYDAEHRLDADGYEYDCVMLEDASPDNPVIRQFIRDALDKAGFPLVEVETKW